MTTRFHPASIPRSDEWFMQVSKLFFQLFKVNQSGKPTSFLGTAFPVRPNGGLLTCRHVVDIVLDDGESVCVLDAERGTLVTLTDLAFPADADLDACFLPDALRRNKEEFFPVLPPPLIVTGEDVYSFGFFLESGERTKTQHGYFKGNIVNVNRPAGGGQALTLSYPVVEGLSGSPVMTYHHGPKALGLAFGSISSRIAASEVIEYEEGDVTLRETISRIVEFGLAYGSDVLIRLDQELGIGLTVSGDMVEVPGLE